MRNYEIDGKSFQKVLKGGMIYLEKNKEIVNALNVFPVPDGDTGTNMSLTIKSAIEQALSIETNSVTEVADAASLGSLMGARGNSGVILSQIFRGFASGVKGAEVMTSRVMAEGFKQAAQTAYKAVMKPVEGTILTVAKDMGRAAVYQSKDIKDPLALLEIVIKAGEESLDRTPELLPVLKESNVVDAGGKGLMFFLNGVMLAAKGDLDEALEDIDEVRAEVAAHDHEEIDEHDITYGYCTEFMIEADAGLVDEVKAHLSELGDSLIAVGDQGIIKVHVHTDNPGRALELAISYGDLRNIKIDNMRYQHKEILRKEMEESAKPHKKYGIITVASGKGLEAVFKDLSADYVILGGQTMNPSTEDFMKALDMVNADHYFLLPNNKNIVLAAEQAQKLSEKDIYVIPSKTIPQGISALISFNEMAEPEENVEEMNESRHHVKSGQITYAVRDTKVNSMAIKKDQIIGIAEGDIKACGEDINQVTEEVIDSLLFDDATMISLIVGEDMDMDKAEEFFAYLEDRYDDYDVELIDGGQPIYYYLVSID